jgi:pimeloyl-ACP methyl ester carboxylesterase
MSDKILEKKFIDSGRGEIHYSLKKSGQNATSVVFLHGLSSNHTTWIEIMNEIAKKNISSLALDMRGHGHSDKARKRDRYKIAVFREDLEKIIEKEKIDKFIILGYSFSGAVAIDYALKNPDKAKGIILISANHSNPLKHKWFSWITPLLRFIINAFGWIMIWQKRKKYYYFEQGKSKGYWDSTLKGFGTMPLSINYWMLSEMGRIDYSNDLEKITCPVLLVRSISDPFYSQKEMDVMAGKIHDCQAITINQTSHFLATAHQDQIKDLIVNFINKVK